MSFIETLSRREMILGGAATLLASAAAATPTIPRSQSEIEGSDGLAVAGRVISVVSPSHHAFEAQMGSLFPGLSKNPDFLPVAPLAFLITNVSGPMLKAFRATWQVTTPGGVHQATFMYYGRSGSTSLLTGGKKFLSTGKTRLVTPSFFWSPGFVRQQAAFIWKQALGRNESEKLLIREAANATEIHVQLDAAVYADWVAIGPSASELATHLSARRNAEIEEATSMLAVVKADAPRSVVADTLRLHQSIEGVAGMAIPRSDAEKHWHYHARTLHAKALLKQFHGANKGTFLKNLTRVSNQPKTVIKVVIS